MMAKYHEYGLSDELSAARKTVTSLADSIYAGKTRKEKLAFRFIKNLHG